MASLQDSPELNASRELAWRRTRLLNRGFRKAEKRGDTGRALAILDESERTGIPVGRRIHAEEVAGVGERDYARHYERQGLQPPQEGLAGFDFRQAKDRGAPGVGGYSFEQTHRSPLARPLLQPPGAAPVAMPVEEGIYATTVPAAAQTDTGLTQPTPSLSATGPAMTPAADRAGFSREWSMAQTDEERQAIIARARELGIPMNMNLAAPYIERRRRYF